MPFHIRIQRAKHTTDCAMCVCVCSACMFSSFAVQFIFHVFCVMCTFVCLIHHYFAIYSKKQKIIRPLCDPHNLRIKTYGFFSCYRLICVFVCLFPSKYTWNTNEITKTNSNSVSPTPKAKAATMTTTTTTMATYPTHTAHKQYALMFSHFTE